MWVFNHKKFILQIYSFLATIPKILTAFFKLFFPTDRLLLGGLKNSKSFAIFVRNGKSCFTRYLSLNQPTQRD